MKINFWLPALKHIPVFLFLTCEYGLNTENDSPKSEPRCSYNIVLIEMKRVASLMAILQVNCLQYSSHDESIFTRYPEHCLERLHFEYITCIFRSRIWPQILLKILWISYKNCREIRGSKEYNWKYRTCLKEGILPTYSKAENTAFNLKS